MREVDLVHYLAPLFGIALMLALAYAASTDRRSVQPRVILWGLGLQFAFALAVLKTPWGSRTFQLIGRGVNRLLGFAFVGSEFVFGPLGMQQSREPEWC